VSSVSKISKVKYSNIDIIRIPAGYFGIGDGHIKFSVGPSLKTSLPEELKTTCLSSKKLIVQYNENKDACDTNNGNILVTTGWNELVGDELAKFKIENDGNISYPAVLNAWVRIIAVQEYNIDIDCRPARRTIVKSRIGTKYPGFEFKGLQEGDSVKIYSVSGKKIREITSGDDDGFVWDGRKDNGDWAKSGIYVYQIKVEGKLISGTIVFVY